MSARILWFRGLVLSNINQRARSPSSRSEDRPNRSVAIQLWVIGALLPVALIVVGVGAHRDFELLWTAAREVLWGDPAAIYRFGAAHSLADGSRWSEGSIFPYPPHALLLFIQRKILWWKAAE